MKIRKTTAYNYNHFVSLFGLNSYWSVKGLRRHFTEKMIAELIENNLFIMQMCEVEGKVIPCYACTVAAI